MYSKKHYSKSFSPFHSLKNDKGFTLVELLVSISILVVITAVILVNQNRFGGQITLTNLAYTVALTVRQAQTYGLSVRETNAGTGNFSAAYGIHFTPSSNQQFILFVDLDNNGRYTDSSENVSLFKIQNGNRLYGICATTSISEKCNPTISYLDITFKRPNPDAVIKSDITTDVYGSAKITFISGQGLTRYVYVSATGQIAVQQTAL